MNKDTLWAIAYRKNGGKWGLYVGTWQTRKHAIANHTHDKGRDWRWCVSHGDRAVKVTFTFPDPKQ